MADVKVYEHNTLVAAMKERAKQYEELEKQITALKKEFDTIVKMDDELQGNGAKSIKGFYGAQGELADAWLRLIGANIAFFNGVSGSAEESKLSGDTVVMEPFLEDEVSNGLKKSKEIVTAQQDDLKKIFHNIDDILSLQVFSKETFEDEIDKADKKRNNTIEAVNKFDASLMTEYAVSEQQEIYLITLLGTIMNSSSQDGKISPMYFDSKSYKNSDVYKQMGDVKKANSDYLTFKKDQAKARKQAKELKEQENRPWYEKAWDTAKTFTGEITGYYDFIRATEGVDPVTHEKLTAAQRAAAAAMAAAGFIPVVGWAGRAAKGGVAIYRTAKVLNAADHALDAYKTTKGFTALQKTEKGLYALAAANGMGEGITGRDFLGNKLTEEQKQQSLIQAFSILGLGAAGKFIGGKPANIPFNTYSKQYAQQTVKNAQNTLREICKQIGKVDVPVGAKVLKMAGNGPVQPKVLAVETKTLSEVKQGLGEKLAKKKEQKQVHRELRVEDEVLAVTKISAEDHQKINNWMFPPSEEKYLKYKEVYDNPKYYNQEDGSINWPPNNGFEGERILQVLEPGTIIDRYGAPQGYFLSPVKTPYEQRALALHSDEAPYYQYKIIRPLEVESGKIAPWFDRSGGGTQYLTEKFQLTDPVTGKIIDEDPTVTNLIKYKYLKELE
ncbi:T7SS effector LXG polymorphic toxin [Actinomycetes bacterium NPDC127524]